MNLEKSYALLRNGVRMNLAVLNAKLSVLPRKVPHSLFLCLTTRCQLRCGHCRYLQPSHAAGRAEAMPLGLASRILAGAAASGIPRVIMFGGEPALYGNLEKVVKTASDLGMFVEMDTNGLLLEEKKLSFLASAGLSALRISLHSPSAPVHNRLQNARTFQLVKDAARRAVKNGFLVYLSSCLSGERSGAADIAGLSALGKSWGVHGIRFLEHISSAGSSAAGPSGIAAEIRKSRLENYARTCFETAQSGGCAAQRGKTLFAGTDGTLRACPYSVKVLRRAGTDFSGLRPGRDRKTLPCAA